METVLRRIIESLSISASAACTSFSFASWLVITSHEAKERDVQDALAEIDKLSMIRRKTVSIRMERG